jgi:two-component system, sensor histidine kinase YesM
VKHLPEVLNSIKFKYTMLVVVAVFVFVVSGNIVLNKLSDEAFQSAGKYAVGNLGTVAVNVDEIMRNIDTAFTPLFANPDFNDIISNIKLFHPIDTYEQLEKFNQLSSILLRSYVSNNYIHSIYFYNSANDIAIAANPNISFVTDISIKSTDWYASYKKIENKSSWAVSNGLNSNEKLLSSYRNINNIYGTQNIGIISINMNSSVISVILSKINFDKLGYAFVNDFWGNTVVAPQNDVTDAKEMQEVTGLIKGDRQEGYFKAVISGESCLLAYHVSGYSGLRYIAVIPMKAVNTFTPIVMRYASYIYIALISMLALMAAITYSSFYRPLNKLFIGMRRLQLGDFSVRLKSGDRGDVGYIYNNFNNMVKNLNQLVEENYVVQLNKKDAQLKMVLSQINEHFFYNTLDCIHWMAIEYKADVISDMILSLSRFYSLSLSNGRDVIEIKDILTIIDSYMYIQNMRKPDSFKYICTMEQSLENTMALKYLFQPLVENAVMHGMEDNPENGEIEVSFKRNDAMLHFEVSDNGKGISKHRLHEIMQSLSGVTTGSNVAFALTNINSQIKLFYGDEYGLCIESVEGHGTRVWMDIPVIEEGDPNVQNDDY